MKIQLQHICQSIIGEIENNGGFFEVCVPRVPASDGMEVIDTGNSFSYALNGAKEACGDTGNSIAYIEGYVGIDQYHPSISLCVTPACFGVDKTNSDSIRAEFLTSDVCMSEFLASVPADGLTLEEAFNLYISARKWADGDRFFVAINEEDPYVEL